MKNILFLGLDYHGYTTAITQELERSHGQVDYYSIQPRTLKFKIVRRLSIRKWQRMLDEHHSAIIDNLRNSYYDLVIFIQAHQISEKNLLKLRHSQDNARFVLYNWDSIKTHDYTDKMWAFDQIFTFDPDDATRFGLEYLPLFCLPDFYQLNRAPEKCGDIYFVGNIGTMRRFLALQHFSAYCKDNNISFKSYQVASPYIYAKVLLAGHSTKSLRLSSITPRAIAEMMSTNTAVFDFANHFQSGLTMRTIENLCAGVKIITSNRRVMDEPFYSPDRILVYDDLDFSGVKRFLSEPLASPEERFQAYHLPSFVQRLVSCDQGDSTNALSGLVTNVQS